MKTAIIQISKVLLKAPIYLVALAFSLYLTIKNYFDYGLSRSFFLASGGFFCFLSIYFLGILLCYIFKFKKSRQSD
jgi:pilus assembly protein TadC